MIATGEFDINHWDVKGNTVLHYTKKKKVIDYLTSIGAIVPEKENQKKMKDVKYNKKGIDKQVSWKKHTAGDVWVFNLVSLWENLSEEETWKHF